MFLIWFNFYMGVSLGFKEGKWIKGRSVDFGYG